MSSSPQVPGLPGMPEPTGRNGADAASGGLPPGLPGGPPPVLNDGGAGLALRQAIQNFTICPDILPLEMQVLTLAVQGKTFMLCIFMTPSGAQYYFMEPEDALRFATNLAMNAKQATTGIHLPNGFNPLN